MALSDDKIWDLWNAQGTDDMSCAEAFVFARAIEAEARRDALKLCRAMPAGAELLAHIKKAVPGLTRVNTALVVAKAVLEKFGSRHAASEVK